VEGRVPDVLDDEPVREFREWDFEERAYPFWAWKEGNRELCGCILARAVASLLEEEQEEERERLCDASLTRFAGTTVCVDVVERDDDEDEDEEGAGECERGLVDLTPLGIECECDGLREASDWA
jgi:hypothetical protein